MDDRYTALAKALAELEALLRHLRLWQAQPPPAEALASRQPFACDTLELHQWLQFIFLPRMTVIVQQRQALPGACAVAPMAEEAYRAHLPRLAPLVEQLRRLDALIA